MSSTDSKADEVTKGESAEVQQTVSKPAYNSCLPVDLIYGVFPAMGVSNPKLTKVYDAGVFTRDTLSSLFAPDFREGKILVLYYNQLQEESIATTALEQVLEEIDKLFSEQIASSRIIKALTRMKISVIDRDETGENAITVGELLRRNSNRLHPKNLEAISREVRIWTKTPHRFSRYAQLLGEYLSKDLARLQENWNLAGDIGNSPKNYTYIEVPGATELVEKSRTALETGTGLVKIDQEKLTKSLTTAYAEFLQEENLL